MTYVKPSLAVALVCLTNIAFAQSSKSAAPVTVVGVQVPSGQVMPVTVKKGAPYAGSVDIGFQPSSTNEDTYTEISPRPTGPVIIETFYGDCLSYGGGTPTLAFINIDVEGFAVPRTLWFNFDRIGPDLSTTTREVYVIKPTMMSFPFNSLNGARGLNVGIHKIGVGEMYCQFSVSGRYE